MLGGALGPIFRAAMGEHFRYAVGVVAVEDHVLRLGWPVFGEGRRPIVVVVQQTCNTRTSPSLAATSRRGTSAVAK